MVVYRHSSLICRTLGQVDPQLQKNLSKKEMSQDERLMTVPYLYARR